MTSYPTNACPVCGSREHELVLTLPPLPVVVNAQVRQPAAAAVPRGEVELVVCTACAHLYNRRFDPAIASYDASYENSLHFSPSFATHASELASLLVEQFGLRGRTVAELGSGPGHFLASLCDAGVETGLGFDPSFDPDRLGAIHHPGVVVSSAPFPGPGELSVPFALSQHVFEHLTDPVPLLGLLRAAVVEFGGIVYTEVPNGELMVTECALWDIIYEHVSYFVPTSLDLACRRAGLSVSQSLRLFGDQFLATISAPAEIDESLPDRAAVEAAVDAAGAFGLAAAAAIERFRSDLDEYNRTGPVALWGAGSKGMSFLNLMEADHDSVAAVVDINPRKSGYGVPGTALEISAPEVLRDIRPTTVLISNPVYLRETRAQLATLGVEAEVRAIWGS